MKTIRTNGLPGFYIWLMIVASAAGLLILVRAWAQWWGTTADEIEPLAPLLELKPGSVIAEIGAGNGAVAIAAAKRVGPSGHIYTTEIDREQIARIRARISTSGLHNVSVIEAVA